MKKRTIKSYFFKNIHRNPSISTLFCFSKRAVKYRTKLHRPTKNSKQSLNLYKFYVNNLVRYNQWTSNKRILRGLFINSFYTQQNTLTNVKYKGTFFNLQVCLWYKLMNTYKMNLNKSLIQYPKTGMLSSHFVHFLSKKNITYQTRSKYRAKIFNMNTIYHYLHAYTKLLYTYLHVLGWRLYFFTSNISKQRAVVDVNFNLNISNWNSTMSKCAGNTQINRVDYTLEDYNGVRSNEAIVSNYLNELDTHKKELLLKFISELPNNLSGLLASSQLSYQTTREYCDNNNACLNGFNKLYMHL